MKPEPAPRWRLALGGIFDFVTAATFWLVWSDADRFGAESVKRLELVLLLEFFVIHASGFFGVLGRKIYGFLGLAAFYLLFVAVLAWSLHARWLLVAFGWLLLSKLQVVWLSTRRAQLTVREQMIDWPFSVAAYLGSLVLCLAALDVPRLSITDQVFAAAGLAGAGLFEDQPWRALAAGTLYFGLLGLWRMRLWRWPGAAWL